MSRSDLRIEAYLARVAAALRGSADRPAILDELRDHLVEAVADAHERGLDEEAATEEALARLGAPYDVAAAFAGRPRTTVLLLAGYAHLAILFGAALAIVGVSGLIAAPLGLLLGPDFISGAPPLDSLGLDRCADLARYQPSASDCADAWSQHFFEESVAFRVIPGLLGGLLVASHLLLLRRLGLAGAWAIQPARGTALVAFAASLAASGLFVIATVVALGDPHAADGFLEATGAPQHVGPGWWISVSIATLTAAAVSGLLSRVLFRSLRPSL